MLRAAIALLMLLVPSIAQAEARFALLIGNQGYSTSVGTLKNPFNDIAVVREALSKQGFEVLPPIKDAKRSAMLGGVRDLVRRLNAAGAGAIGFIYYSGHGAAEKDTNINYLIPVDASAPGTTAFWDESVKLDDVLRLLDGARSAAKFIVFDACRNELQLPTKDTSKGLVPVAEQQGMFIAYASAPGRTASDMGDKSGPYAAALAAELAHPGLDHLNLFQNVKEAVLTSTGGAQQPWESNGLGRRVYLTGQPKPPEVNEAAREWARVDKTNVTALDAFERRYKGSPEADYAHWRIESLKQQPAAPVTSAREIPPSSSILPAPEVPRSAADDGRRAPEGRLTPEQERLLQQRAELQEHSEREALQRAKQSPTAKQNASANAAQKESRRADDGRRATEGRLTPEQERLLQQRTELQERSEREALQRAKEAAKKSAGSR
jgi:hypothetical protein